MGIPFVYFNAININLNLIFKKKQEITTGTKYTSNTFPQNRPIVYTVGSHQNLTPTSHEKLGV